MELTPTSPRRGLFLRLNMTNPRPRSQTKLKPRFPRLQILFKRRKALDWITTHDDDYMVQIIPNREPKHV